MILNNQLQKFSIKYSGSSLNNNEYILSFKNSEKNIIKEPELSKIVNNAEKVINYFSQPNKNTGILIGQVQSGKTKNFLAVISAAFDNSYDLAIVLSGIDDKIKGQTIKRLKETFGPSKSTVKIIEDDNYKDLILSMDSPITKGLTKGIIPILKNKVVLEKLLDFLRKINKKVIIIDDEGDQASLNIENKKKNNLSTEEASAINKIIRKIIDETNNVSFLSVTATPYGNLIAREESNPLSPSFCVIAEPGDGYCGLETFHNQDSKFIKNIYSENRDLNSYSSEEIKKIEINSLLKNALPAFIVGNVYLRNNFEKFENRAFNMLVHAFRNKQESHELKEKLETKLNDIIMYSKKDKKTIEYQDHFIKNFIEKGLKENNFKSLCEMEKELSDKIISDTKEILEFTTINHIYAKNKETNNNDVDQIFIGSHLIERGVTFDNLRVSFMSFCPQKILADTILQRARWFGYRDLDISPIVYLPDELIETYEKIYFWQNVLYDKLNTEQGLKEIISNGFEFDLLPTRNTVNVDAFYGEWNSESFSQTKESPEFNNYKLESDEISKLIDENGIEQFLKWNHAYIKLSNNELLKYKKIIEKILLKLEINQSFDQFLEIVNEKNVENIYFVLPRFFKNNNQFINTRSLYDDGYLNIFQGKEEGENFDNLKRPNDRQILKKYLYLTKDNKPSLEIQAHIIKVKENDLLKENEYFYFLNYVNCKSTKGVIKND